MRHHLVPFAWALMLGLAYGPPVAAVSCAVNLGVHVESHPKWGPPPPLFKSLDNARIKIEKHRVHLRRYLDPAQFELMDRLLTASNRGSVVINTYVLPALTEIYEQAVQNFADELRTRLPIVGRSLLATAAEADRLGHHSLRITIEQLVKQLNAIAKTMNFTLGVELWTQAPRSLADARAILDAVNEYAIHPPSRPVDVVDSLTALGSVERREDFRRALQTAFDDEEAAARELRRLGKRALGHTDVYGYVPDLNAALGLFTDEPELLPCDSKVCLVGQADVVGRDTLVQMTFDPRERYFTVQTPGRRYYELDIGADGRLTFLDTPPVNMDACAKRLQTTHFSY